MLEPGSEEIVPSFNGSSIRSANWGLMRVRGMPPHPDASVEGCVSATDTRPIARRSRRLRTETTRRLDAGYAKLYRSIIVVHPTSQITLYDTHRPTATLRYSLNNQTCEAERSSRIGYKKR
jgi:hypothetical protein